VEDNEVYLRLRKPVLEQAGYTVLSRGNENSS